MPSRDQILATLSGHLQEMFGLEPERIVPAARLYEDLQLDSIDAVDLIVKLQEYTGRKIAPAEFKSVRTVGDVVDRLHDHLAARA
jgi:acyl carrier protein